MSALTGLIDYIGGILSSLGVDNSFYIQLAIFCITYLAMYFIAIKPYMAAMDERKRRTHGNTSKADDLTQEAVKVKETYSREARELNTQVRSIHNESSQKASQQKAKILAAGQKEAEQWVSQSQAELADAIAASRKQLDQQIPEISRSIEEKFLRT